MGEERATIAALEELQQAFERFKMDNYSKSKFSDIIQYVDALRAENRKLSLSRKEAQTALYSLGNKATSLISTFHPSTVKDETAQKGQDPASGALKFLLEDYQCLWETNDSNCAKIDALDRERKRLRQELQEQDISHQKHVHQISGEYQSCLDREKRRHSDEKYGMTIQYQDQLQQLTDKHTREVDKLNLEHKNSTTVLKANHEEALTNLRVRLEKDLRALQEALVSFADRFQPKSDYALQLQFEDLRGWVGRVARSVLDVDAVELGEGLGQTIFLRLTPKRHHKFALESSIWTILMDDIFATPFKIFGDYSKRFSNIWSHQVLDSESFIFWRI
jgi:hypothetical protein